ncbi:hypothetical protein BASA50_001505 [Batrachochytrium salamandrivorans]|uniref:SOCS box domain-containing protein n=1 Tax=Batrachochytrium salamandrivorans TaxID=1357716 RepID=A0ABQ8FP67_9FUNG|nr:hypothetical protein BASA50_001505 [Batrachochytrium salamandrivorans]KAH9269684.1 hypothetical protein BASA83_008345 [Batrachochytrium salamandrivorans]
MAHFFIPSITATKGHAPSLLDRIHHLPWFISKHIYSFAGPLSQYLLGHLEHPITESTLRLIMVDCFQQSNIPKTQFLLSQYPAYTLIWESLFIQSEQVVQALLSAKRVVDSVRTIHHLLQADFWAFELFEDLVKVMDVHTEAIAQQLFNHVIQNILQPLPKCREDALLYIACSLGRLDIVTTRVGVTRSLQRECRSAIKYNHAKMVRLIIDNGKDVTAQMAFDSAVANGNINLAVTLCRSYPKLEVKHKALLRAFIGGHIDTVWRIVRCETLLSGQGFRSLRRLADAFGHTDLLKYIIANNIGGDRVIDETEFDVTACSFKTAVRMLGGVSGFDDKVLQRAAENGHASFVEELLNCWTDLPLMTADSCLRALERAVERCHYPVVRLLVECGLGITQEVIDTALVTAARYGRLPVFSYLYHLVDGYDARTRGIGEACRCRQVSLIEYAIAHEPFPALILIRSLIIRHYLVVPTMVSHGVVVTPHEISEAIAFACSYQQSADEHDRFGCVCLRETIERVCSIGPVEVVEFVLKHCGNQVTNFALRKVLDRCQKRSMSLSEGFIDLFPLRDWDRIQSDPILQSSPLVYVDEVCIGLPLPRFLMSVPQCSGRSGRYTTSL